MSFNLLAKLKEKESVMNEIVPLNLFFQLLRIYRVADELMGAAHQHGTSIHI